MVFQGINIYKILAEFIFGENTCAIVAAMMSTEYISYGPIKLLYNLCTIARTFMISATYHQSKFFLGAVHMEMSWPG